MQLPGAVVLHVLVLLLAVPFCGVPFLSSFGAGALGAEEDGKKSGGPAGGGGTAVRKSPYRILERKKLATHERKKLEKERAAQIRSAEKALKARLQEYDGVDWADRHRVRTRNFDLQCNSTRQVAEYYGKMIELIRATLAELFPSKVFRNLRAPLFIYKSQEDFIARDPLARHLGRGLGGYYNHRTQALSVYHGTFGFTGTTFSVLCHEGTHYYQGLVLKDFDNMPVWFIEGMAVYFGDGSVFDPKKGRIQVGLIPRDRLAHIQEKLLKKTHTPLDRLVTLTRAGGFNGSHYADAWALIYFLARSEEKGTRFLQSYWALGVERDLTKKDFLDLAQKHYGGVANLEKEYRQFILNLETPPAGVVSGDYFVSDSFGFHYKAPGDDWEFFEDPSDKKLLVGVLQPGATGEIRVYYDNNLLNVESDVYFEEYLKRLEGRQKGLKHEKVKISNLEGYRLTYSEVPPPPGGKKEPGEGKAQEGKAAEGSAGGPAAPKAPSGEAGGDKKGTDKDGTDKDGPGKKDTQKKDTDKKGPEGSGKGQDDGKKAPEAPEPPQPPRAVVEFLLIQVDGVITVRCTAEQVQAERFWPIFEKAGENLTLSLNRRW